MPRLCIPLVILLLASAARVGIAAEPKLLPWELLKDGWIQLFDGHSLFGWQTIGAAEWEVSGRQIRTAGDAPGFLMTTTEWANYELELEFRALADTNSGVFLRSALEPTDPGSDCYELNIAPPENPFPTGSLVARAKSSAPKTRNPSDSDDAWRTFRVTAWDGWISVELDGERVLDYRDPNPRAIGFIALQSNQGAVAFRNIRLRPIELLPFLKRGDLANFSTARAEQSEFELNESKELHVTNGPGQIETKARFANFVLQLECKVNGEGLNSGIFFRALRDARWAGYESQIHNVYRDDDPTEPVDFGTGGIYRRQPARRIVARDGEWFTKTIVADGDHFAVWVNGYQVSDWTDTRPPHENARNGLRLGPGVIAIQGHDPTTDLWFREFRVIELPR